MARFEKGDKISFFRRNEVIRKGEVVSGPFKADNVDHYHVRWDWIHHEDRYFITFGKIDLISDLSSTKYHYELTK